MLSLAELRRAVRVADTSLAQARLQRIVQPDEWSVALTLYGAGVEACLHLSSRPGLARVCEAEEPGAPPKPPAFAQYLRAHLSGVRFAGARLLGEDRQAALRFEGKDERFDLVLSILGPRSNVYVLDAEERLRAALRPLGDTRRDLALGSVWSNPASAAPREGEDRWHDVADEDYLVAIGLAYATAEAEAARDDLLRRIGQALAKELDYLRRREQKLGEDLASAATATGGRRIGELLKGVLHTVPPGAERVVATDYATGEEVVIPLDAALSPSENLARLFKRYHKAQKAIAALEQQREDVRHRRPAIEAAAAELEALGRAPDLASLAQLAGREPVRSVLGRQRRGRGQKAGRIAEAKRAQPPRGALSSVPVRLRPKVYATEEGMEIWVGRSDEGNDHLTTRLAAGNDLFFHVEGAAGSHVVLRTGGRKDPPSGALLDASELAVHFSKARGDDRADVHVAAIKDVKKPRGAKPGLVHVLRGKTIHLRRDQARLRRVLGDKGVGD